jgi:hypothetical protein
MSDRSNSEQSKTVVDAYYQAGVEGRLREFARYLHPDKISEHWTVKNGKATSIWVAYFEPQALLDKLGIAHGLKR